MNKFNLFNQGGQKNLPQKTPWEKEERKSGAGQAQLTSPRQDLEINYSK